MRLHRTTESRQHSVRHSRLLAVRTEGRSQEGGFTLAELVVVVMVLMVLATVSLFVINMGASRGRALYHEVLGTVQSAQYFARDTGCYPADMAILINPDHTGGGTGLSGCQADLAHWHGPYLQGAFTNGQNVALGDDVTGEQGGTLSIQTGTWLSGAPSMAGRGNTEIALLAGPVTPDVQAAFCRRCGGCAPAAGQSTCFTLGANEVGYVFATQ
ncbi:MAG: prepilin-type N-terminal cleavage/methylation domain-containing protein [Acidithiobacillus sp.]